MQIGLANFKSPYRANEQLVYQTGAAAEAISFYPGVYRVYAQGAGGGGSPGDYYSVGGGGGSGAGFEGNVRTRCNLGKVWATTMSGGASTTSGGNTIIGDVVELQGGVRGWNGNSVPGGGIWWKNANVNVIGNAMSNTLDTGIMRGFASSPEFSYAEIPATAVPSGSVWELYTEICLTSIASKQAVVGNTTNYRYPILMIGTNGRVYMYITGNGSSWNIASNKNTSTNAFELEKWYGVKLSWDGSAYNVDVLDKEAETWTNFFTLASTVPIYDRSDSPVEWALGMEYASKWPLLGSLCYKNSYLKVDGEVIWQGWKELPVDIVSYRVASSGNGGLKSQGASGQSGGNSVLTGTGGGYGASAATAHGAGGGAGYSFANTGGAGGDSECKITFVSNY